MGIRVNFFEKNSFIRPGSITELTLSSFVLRPIILFTVLHHSFHPRLNFLFSALTARIWSSRINIFIFS